ncbi:MAG: hypothetical protein L0H93_05355, partial [Nocardioides sp.]|nr:hypothetical protein [Nocardioides sp.]
MIGRLLAAFALALTTLVVFGTPAHACSCIRSSTAEQAAGATHVFVGTITSTSPGQARLLTYDIDVSEVYKGDVPEVTQLRSSSGGASCGLGKLPSERSIAFFATADTAGTLVSNACSGTTLVSGGLSREMSATMGDPALLNQSGEAVPQPQAASPQPGSGGEGAGEGAVLWPWLVALLLAAGGAATWTARRT